MIVSRTSSVPGRWHGVLDGRWREAPHERGGFAGAAMTDRAREPQRWEEVPRVAYDPTARLQAMDVDGVDCPSCTPPSLAWPGKRSDASPTRALELACVQAYNDWLIEEWASASPRFIPQCIVPIAPIEATVQEIKRAVKKGHRGVVFPAIPMYLRDVPHINEPVYDPVWATCQDLAVPVCFHAGSSARVQFPAYDGFSPGLAAALSAMTRPVSSVLVVANFLYSRILMRFPALQGGVCRNLPGLGSV